MQQRLMCWETSCHWTAGGETFSKRQQICLTMQRDDFDDDQILHAVARFCKVTEKGPVESLFDVIQTDDDVVSNKNVAIGGDENDAREILSALNEKFSSFQAQGFAVLDDNNDPAIKNIPTSNDSGADDIYQPRGSEPLDAFRVTGVRDVQPCVVSADPSMHTVLGFFTFCCRRTSKQPFSKPQANPFEPTYMG